MMSFNQPTAGTNQYDVQIANMQAKDARAKKAASNTYHPDLESAFDSGNEWLGAYGKAIGKEPSKIGNLSKGLTDVGAYKAVDWNSIQDQLQSQYTAPTYQGTNYDLESQYAPPNPYEAYNFTAPQIADVTDVQPVSDEVWAAEKTKSSEDTGNRYKDLRTIARDELIRTGKRSEQSAAVLSGLGVKEEKARREGDRDIGIEKAKQAVGIAQAKQALDASRATSQAGLDAQAQENMAKEMATKYGMDVDAARYAVSNYVQQNQLNAAENQTKYSIDTEAARYTAAQDQWAAEQNAAEAQKVYQSKYGMAQDVAQTKMATYQANQASKMDYFNAVLQGGEAARSNAAQQSTYWTNLNKGERAAAPAAKPVAPTAPTRTTSPSTIATKRTSTAMPAARYAAPAKATATAKTY